MTVLEFSADLGELGRRPGHAAPRVNGSSARVGPSFGGQTNGIQVSDRHHDSQKASPTKEELYRQLDLDKKYVRSDGSYVYDANGIRYLDFARFGVQVAQDEQRLVRQAAALGEQLRRALKRLQREFPMLVADVR